MKPEEFLTLHRKSREKWDIAVSKIPVEILSRPLPGRDWTLKDIIAHLTWHEREMVDMLRSKTVAGSPLWEKSTDDRNHQIFLQNKDRELGSILKADKQVHAELMEELALLTEEELNDPSNWKDWPAEWTGEWAPWKVIASNTYEHLDDHLPDLLQRS
jgi:hypothetical protein